MPPITKFWLCALKDPASINNPEFRNFITEILEFCSSYTNPEPDSPPMHAFYKDTADPARLFMITGYQSKELNTEADKIYAEKYLPKMREFVEHKMLRQVEFDIKTLPIGEHVSVAYGKKSSTWTDEDQPGGWDVLPTTPGADEKVTLARDEEDRVWVQVSKWNGADSVLASVQPIEGERLFLEKIASR